MPVTRLLVANRGEVATRVLHGAATLGIPAVLAHAHDDPPPSWADRAERLPGTGPAAYLDQDALIAAGVRTGCDAVHPGWGFLAERDSFAARCADAGLTFVGPSPTALELFGDKAAARELAGKLDIAVLPGTRALTGEDPDAELAEAAEFLRRHSSVLVKAVAGGGGRGIRVVERPEELADALERCRSEARHGFGAGAVYLERRLPGARHVEVQLVGDHTGAVVAVGDRDCSLQRRRQKLIEIAPAPGLPDELRATLWAAAEALGGAVDRLGVATAEFLVADGEYVFLEVNARLQVEHTVTEQVTGLDLVATQLRLAAGATLDEVGCPVARGAAPGPARVAVQARLNAERITADGEVHPGGGELTRFVPPGGPGVRVDTHCFPGFVVDPRYDPLLAKVIATAPDLAAATALAERALGRFDVAGTPTNRALLRSALVSAEYGHSGTPHSRRLTTDFVDTHLQDLLGEVPEDVPAAGTEDHRVVTAPRAAVVVEVAAAAGQRVAAGRPLVVLEAMKMEYVLPAPTSLLVREVLVDPGTAVAEGAPLLAVEPADPDDAAAADGVEHRGPDLDTIRDDLAEVLARQRGTRDEGRPDAVRARRALGRRTARENVADLCDPGTFVEYGALTVAAQRRRRELAELIARTPGDGMVAGTGRIDGLRAAVLSYDYTVLAGTQGVQNHRKTDRLLELARREEIPVVIFAEGGGGRPGDTDQPGFTGLDVPTFRTAAELAGRVPTVGVVSGYCFAGNAALAAVCDVLIGTEEASLGMGGPAMISGGGLGEVAPGDVGPMPVHARNGVIDLLVTDDAAAVAATRRYLSYVGGRPVAWGCDDQRKLRFSVPENRVRAYPVRPLLTTLFDTGSLLELRAGYGVGMITAFARLNGRPVGVYANNPDHLGGAIDADAADKTARFLGICDAYRLPVVAVCDTPGFMVGPDAERVGLVRRAGAMFTAGAHLRAPLALLVTRKGYGLAAMAMAGGALRSTAVSVCWPTGEFGGMNLEGATRLRYRRELAQIEDAAQRQARFDELVARQYEHGKALSTATAFDIDDVIDPATTRDVLAGALGLD